MTAFSSVVAFGDPRYGGNPAFRSEQERLMSRKTISMQRDGWRLYLPIHSDVDTPVRNAMESCINLGFSDSTKGGLLSVQIEFEKDVNGFIVEGTTFPYKALQSLYLISTHENQVLFTGLRFGEDTTMFPVDEDLEFYSKVVDKLTTHAVEVIGKTSCTIQL